jgi:hypothetical protein
VTTATDIEEVGGVPESLWDRILAEPDRTPELIALAAAERFGPQAERWVASHDARNPERLAKRAYRRHVRLSRLEGGALGLGGGLTAPVDLVALLWIQGRMVFFIAAAYGHDPRDPMRPAELLALQGVYPTADEARRALDGVGKRLAQALAERTLRGGGDRRMRARLLRYAVRRVAGHYSGRLIPLIGAPIGAIQNAGATKELGRKALAYYRKLQARP